MDITLVRQGSYNKERIGNKDVECISESDITKISKSTLRILYACGKRPLYIDKGKDWKVSVEKNPQPLPDCILCGRSNLSFQSARVIREQLKNMGISVKIERLDSLSETTMSGKQLKRSYARLIKNSFDSLAKKGIQHIVVVAEPNKLSAISYAMTGKDTNWKEEDFVKAIKSEKEDYTYDPERPEYITEGILDTMMLHMINTQDCPEKLKEFSGKVRHPINSERLAQIIRKRFLQSKKSPVKG